MSYGQSSRNKSPGKMKSWSPSRSGGHIYGSHGKASAIRDKRDVSQVRPTLYVSRSSSPRSISFLSLTRKESLLRQCSASNETEFTNVLLFLLTEVKAIPQNVYEEKLLL